jgi:hypothetical protein
MRNTALIGSAAFVVLVLALGAGCGGGPEP